MDHLVCECGKITPLIEGVCGDCISKAKKDIKQRKRDVWATMTEEQRIDYKFDKYIAKSL